MGKETGDRNFKLIAMAMMGVTGLATLFHAVHTLMRDLRDDRRHEPSAGRSPQQPHLPTPTTGSDEPVPPRRWTQRPELADRQPCADHTHATHRPGHGRQL